MMVAVWVVLAALGVGLFIVCGALVEMYRSLEQVRLQSGISDAPTKIDVDLPPDALARAGLDSQLVAHDRALLLILSDRCTTCDVLAASMGEWVPDRVLLLLHPTSAESGRRWLARHGMANHSSVVMDDDSRVSDAIGIHITPTALRVSAGEVVATHTVPSSRRLFAEFRWVAGDEAAEPIYQQPSESYYEVVQQSNTGRKRNTSLTKGTQNEHIDT